MGLNARDSFNSALSLFSSLYQDMNPTDLPEGLSPDNQDVWFLPGSVSTRPAVKRYLNSAIGGTPQILSEDDFPLPSGQHVGIFLDANGAIWQRNTNGTTTQLTSVNAAGLQFKSETAFDKQFYAFYGAAVAASFSQSPFVGVDIPRYFDGSNFWRVTQDAPGAGPAVGVVSAPSATVQGAGVPVTVSIVAGPSGITGGEIELIGKAIYYTTLLITTSTPHGFSVGQSVTIAGSTSTPSVNRTWVVAAVDSATSFEITYTIKASLFTAGGGGTVGTTASSGNSMVRQSNFVSVNTAAAHGFQVGWQVQITGVANTSLGGGISTISRDANGVVTVVTASAHGLAVGNSFAIVGVTNPDTSFNGNFTVASVVSATSFTYKLGGTAVSSTGGTGNVQDVWTGKFIILSVPTTTSFTYQHLAPNDSTTATGTATIIPLMAGGLRSLVMMFKSLNGAITAPSIPIQVNGDGVNLLALSTIPIGPDGTAQRIIAFTPAFGSNYYYLSPSVVAASGLATPGTIINDNTSTSAIIDFSDAALLDGTQIDILGNDLFAQVVLAPCLGVVEYQGRLGWWGEINNLKNLINMGFDGGYTTSKTTNRAGSGANGGGGGTAWTNPSNVTSVSSYADLSSSSISQELICEAFGFAVAGPLGDLTVSFDTYGTISSAGSLLYTMQLLKAGVAFGTPVTGLLTASSGSSGAPLNFSFTLSSAGLTAADLNAANFGIQINVAIFEVAGSFTCHIRNLQIGVVIPNLTPLGWISNLPSGGALGTGALVNLGNPGFAYQMTSNGGSSDCLIQQAFYQDYYGAPIWIPGRQYLVRMLAKTSNPAATGSLAVEIGVGPGQGLYIANIAANTLTSSFRWVTAAISALPAASISGVNLNIYLSGVTAGAAITIDEVEIVDSIKPVLSDQLRISYFNNEFGYDENTGLIGLDTSGQMTAAFRQRGTLYMLTDQATGSMFRTQNNGSTEPNGWGVDEFAKQVDCAGPSAVDTGEGVAWWAGQSGLRIFAGDTPKKLSQEIQPTWDGIDWTKTLSVFVKNDPLQRMLYTGGAAIGKVLPMSYRSVNTALEPADPLHISFSGKLICSDLCRKWTRWNLPVNCAAMLTQGNASQMVFGAGFGQLYSLDFSRFTDDDYGTIQSYYTTYFYWNHEMEQNVPQLGLHRKIYTYLSAYITGVGNVIITPLVDALANAWAPLTSAFDEVTGLWKPGAAAPPISEQLSTALDHDLEWRLNVIGDRVAFKVAVTPLTGQTEAYFNLQHIVVAGRMEANMPVRGAYL
jgi:hypothetical protein